MRRYAADIDIPSQIFSPWRRNYMDKALYIRHTCIICSILTPTMTAAPMKMNINTIRTSYTKPATILCKMAEGKMCICICEILDNTRGLFMNM